MRERIYIFFWALCCLFFSGLYSQSPRKFTPQQIWESGLPFILNYEAKEYKSNPQNWCFLEGNNNFLYVGNTLGILEYDGVQWNTISLSNSSLVRSLAKTDEGKIYAGGVKEMGYLESDSIGRTRFQSLLPQLDSIYHDFTDVWNTRTLGNEVFFCTNQYLFKWDGTKFKVWKSKGKFGNMFEVHGNLYVPSKPEGILTLKNDELVPIPGGDFFNKTLGKVADMQPLHDGAILVSYSYTGLYKYENNQFTPILLYNSIFEKSPLYEGTLLPNGDYAAATIGQGIYIFDIVDRKIKKVIRKKHGLISDVIFSLYSSSDGALWVGTDDGISKVDISSPLRRFNELNGLSERVRNVYYHNENLFVGSNGLYYMDAFETAEKFTDFTFEKVVGIKTRARNILPVADEILCFSGSFIYLINNQNQVQLITKTDHPIVSSVRSRVDTSRVYLGSLTGNLYELKKLNKDWELNYLTKIPDEIFKIAEDDQGNLWISTQYNGLYRITGVSKSEKQYDIAHYTEKDGLPTLTWNLLYAFDKKIFVGSEGMFSFDVVSNSFYRDTLLMEGYQKSVSDFGPMASDNLGNIWQTVREGLQNKIYKIENGEPSELPESNLFPEFNTYDIHSTGDIVFFSGPDGIIAYNQKMGFGSRPKIPGTKLRTVKIKNDSLIYSGGENMDVMYEIPITANTLVFNYAFPDFNKPESNQYQYMLAGFDDDWSDWTSETKVNYTNLSEGAYQFRVKAKNVFGLLSKEDTFKFTMLPPWYRTWWAYLIYAAFAGLLLWLFSLWRSRQLQHKNIILEKIVKRRTDEIRQKNKQLAYQAEKLKEMDTMKTRLFANISHEFRTPLTLIKGPIEKLEQQQKTMISMPNIKMIRRSANRLLNLVNQLLDLSKLDSGKLGLNEAEGDVFRCIRAAASAFSSHAASRNMDYQIRVPSDLLWASFDRDKMEKVIYNLLSNAFKFTEDKGQVILLAEFRSHRLHLKVSDTGSGIAREKLSHIFDRFFQVDDSYTREKTGSGIGLALTKELVELMGGTIYVESELGKGTIFKVVLPMEEIRSYKRKEPEELSITPFDDEDYVPKTKVSEADGENTKVLVIEDNNDMRHFIREQLEPQYAVLEAINGKEGLKRANKIVPDLIITDLMMPRMDGITLCKKLKSNLATSHIPVIMLTAKAGIENKLEGLETGADDYLTKPFNAKELFIRTKNLIEQRKQLRELFSRNISLDPKEITVTSLDEKFLRQVISLLEENYSNSRFGLPQMQKAMALSRTQLHYKLKALTNYPPGELLRNFRLKRAAQLLSQKADNISQIAYDVGFNSASYFTRCFKELYGMSPTAYQQKNT